MKKTLLSLIAIFAIMLDANAQWVSPGNGTTYTLPDLVDVSNGAVAAGTDGFVINADVTISTNDVLKIDNQVTRIDVADVLITISGSMICTNTNAEMVEFRGLNETEHFKIRFENAVACDIKKMYFSYGAGIKVIDSEVTFDDVKFAYFTKDYCNAVIDIFNCNPVIKNCFFVQNEGAAISSPANGQASPQIVNCTFDGNVTSNSNHPQINLGPGSLLDTIYIVGNAITGAFDMSGGISVSDLLETGSTKVLLKNNIVRNNRYGYNQQGKTISSLVVGNEFIDNNLETNPMNGGSGISIFGYSVNNKAILRNNVITGNLWGITAIYLHDIDMGTEEDWGSNEIHDNGNSGNVYDLYNNSTCDLLAVGNDWGVATLNEIEDHIVHKNDDPELGLVTFYPFIGIEWIDENVSEYLMKDNRVYTLEGRCLGSEVPANYKGVYIRNGRKYLK